MLEGTEGRDRILGLRGNDLLSDEPTTLEENSDASIVGARDRLSGGSGNDTVYGEGEAIAVGVAEDDVDTGAGTAAVTGADDRVDSGRGEDSLFGDGVA